MQINLQNEVEIRPIEGLDEENVCINQFNTAMGTSITNKEVYDYAE